MLLTKRFGVVGRSSRSQLTALPGSASTFLVAKTRPVCVAAQAVVESVFVRSIATTDPPARSPRAALFNDGSAICTQSPQTTLKSPVHVLQCCCASAIVMVPRPWVFVRHAFDAPANIHLLIFGSLMIGE